MLIGESFINTTESQGLSFNNSKLSTRTHSSFECFGSEIINLNFREGKIRLGKLISQVEILSNQTELKKIQLPFYYAKNRLLFNNCYNICKTKKNSMISSKIEHNFNLIAEKLSELEFRDLHLEITNQGVVKATLLFDENKFLIISKDEDDDTNDFIYSYFIDRKLIDADVTEITGFVHRFKEYRNL